MNLVLQILVKIALSLATESLAKALIANGLEQIKNHTSNSIDDSLLNPVIEALRQK
jgi:hypothetical protein